MDVNGPADGPAVHGLRQGLRPPVWAVVAISSLLSWELAAVAAGEPGSQLQLRIAQRIAELDSPSYARREQAQDDLLRAGSSALPQLERAGSGSKPERAARATWIRKQIVQQELWTTRLLHLKGGRQTLAAALRQLAEKTGLLVDPANASISAAAVDLPHRGELWPTLDHLCRQVGCELSWKPDNLGRRVTIVYRKTGPEDRQEWIGYAGPLRCCVRRAAIGNDAEATLLVAPRLTLVACLQHLEIRSENHNHQADNNALASTSGSLRGDSSMQLDQWQIPHGRRHVFTLSVPDQLLPQRQPPATNHEPVAWTVGWEVIAAGQWKSIALDQLRGKRVADSLDVQWTTSNGELRVSVGQANTRLVPELFLWELRLNNSANRHWHRAVTRRIHAGRVELNAVGKPGSNVHLEYPTLHSRRTVRFSMK